MITAIVLALVAVSIFVAIKSRQSASINRSLMYPGAGVVVDLKGLEGSTLHLRTKDSFDKVVEWYVASLKPAKTIKVSETSVILKAGHTTVTVVSENNETNVVIKQAG